jgi:pimeloyl-ACP methyl ester carboxylesterase
VLSTEKAAATLSRATGDASTATDLRSGHLASVSPPTGIGELVGRIPTGDEQIRIERYPGTDGDRWIVLIDGTRSGSLGTEGEPWDMASNLQGIAGVPSASTEAVLEAMRRAGIDAQDPVLLVGYSQGGLIAARVAEQRGTAAGLVTVGSPIAGLPLPRDIPVLAIEHTEDPVPALGGVAGAGTAASLSTVTVRRTLYADAPPSDDRLVPAHQFARYRETAELVDASEDSRLAPIRAVLAEFAADGTAQGYRAERAQESPSREPASGRGRGST